MMTLEQISDEFESISIKSDINFEYQCTSQSAMESDIPTATESEQEKNGDN